MGQGYTKVSSCHTPSLDICFQPLETILLFPRYFSIVGFAAHQKQHSSASWWSCVLNLKSSWQLNPTKAAATAVGNPSQRRGPCCWVEFPDLRSEWAMELIGLWGPVGTMTSPLRNCFCGEHVQGGVGYGVLGAGFGRHRIKWIDQRWLHSRWASMYNVLG